MTREEEERREAEEMASMDEFARNRGDADEERDDPRPPPWARVLIGAVLALSLALYVLWTHRADAQDDATSEDIASLVATMSESCVSEVEFLRTVGETGGTLRDCMTHYVREVTAVVEGRQSRMRPWRGLKRLVQTCEVFPFAACENLKRMPWFDLR